MTRYREIAKAWRWKHMLGGAMRQSGILAAAGVYAMENNIGRLKDDHANAKLIAQELGKISGLQVDTPNPETNIVFFRVTDGRMTNADFVNRALEKGVRFSGLATGNRAVTHLDISRDNIIQAAKVAREVMS